MQSRFSFDYYCLNCKSLMETSDAPVISGQFYCGFCGASMLLDAAKGIGLARPCLVRSNPTPSRTSASDKLAGTVWNRTPPPHSGVDHTSVLDER